MILGDFNLVYKAGDKSNGRVNRRLTNEFRWFLNDLELKELYLHGCCFTWASATTDPTMTKIDHVFCISPLSSWIFGLRPLPNGANLPTLPQALQWFQV
jgi:hypothetical protein